jgi:plastocyanin
MTQKSKANTAGAAMRWSLVAGIAVLALVGSYAFASTRARTAQAATPGQPPSAAAAKTASAGCVCCGPAKPAGPATTGKANTTGAVQKISVDVSKGYYDPSTIELKAGVPAEITFSQSGGCTAQVQSQDLGFSADLSQGPATVKLPALTPGTYGFACGMNMVFGTIVVK